MSQPGIGNARNGTNAMSSSNAAVGMDAGYVEQAHEATSVSGHSWQRRSGLAPCLSTPIVKTGLMGIVCTYSWDYATRRVPTLRVLRNGVRKREEVVRLIRGSRLVLGIVVS